MCQGRVNDDTNRTRTHCTIQSVRRLSSYAGRYVRLRNYKQVEGKGMNDYLMSIVIYTVIGSMVGLILSFGIGILIEIWRRR